MLTDESVIDRVRFYVKDRHNGNKSDLARQWGTTYAQIQAVTSGTRKLTFSTLNNAALKGYNVHWLLTGTGEPYIAVSERKNHSEFEQKIDPQLIELYSQLVATKDELIEGMRKTINELRQPKKEI